MRQMNKFGYSLIFDILKEKENQDKKDLNSKFIVTSWLACARHQKPHTVGREIDVRLSELSSFSPSILYFDIVCLNVGHLLTRTTFASPWSRSPLLCLRILWISPKPIESHRLRHHRRRPIRWKARVYQWGSICERCGQVRKDDEEEKKKKLKNDKT